MNGKISYRKEVRPTDIQSVREILSSTGFFQDFEIDVAIELVEEFLLKGVNSGYNFLFAELGNKAIAYSCFGAIPCTKHSFDLYWIGVHEDYRGKGLGKIILAESENRIREMHGEKIFIETSSTEKYLPTRNFYLKNGYLEAAFLKDFYASGDSKYIYEKSLSD
jgi:ribosomal protein S18 acetylase RimI-like enzyme